tara:strand:- start:6131 stop:10426 length:4296 start_codon:yes stop_codon:yes gene_type:complete
MRKAIMIAKAVASKVDPRFGNIQMPGVDQAIGNADGGIVEDHGKTVPESPRTLELQRQMLMQGKRKAMLYTPGTPIPPPIQGIMGVRTPQGVIHYNPSLISHEEVVHAAKNNRLNEVLGLGPYSKDDVAEKVMGGEPLLAVVSRDQNGHEAVSAAGTPSTANEQIASLHEHAPEGGSVGIEPFEQVVGERGQGPVERAFGGDVEPRDLNDQGLYSHAAEAAEALPQAKGTGQQMLASLKGVKPEELKWSGAQDAFADRPSVTRDELAQHFRDNAPKIQETVLKNEPPSAENDWSTTRGAKFSQHTIPGGKNYREVLMHLPKNENEDDNFYHREHWGDKANVLAHLRLSDRPLPNGGTALHMEELQSDWAQRGRKEGFSTAFTPEERLQYDLLQNERSHFHEQMRSASDDDDEAFDRAHRARQEVSDKMRELSKKREGLPSAPYVGNTNNWTDLGLKRALTEAASGGHDKLIWTPGQEQADRYDLSKRIGQIHVEHPTNPDFAGKISLTSYGVGDDDWEEGAIDHRVVHPDQLDDVVGKEVADRIRNRVVMPSTKSGYAVINPVSRNTGPIFDTEEEAEADRNRYPEPHKLKVIPHEQNIRGQGIILRDVDLKTGGEGMKGYYDNIVPKRLLALARDHDPEAAIGSTTISGGKTRINGMPSMYPEQHKVPSIDITPKMRESILSKGFKSFARGGDVEAEHMAVGGDVEPSRVSFEAVPGENYDLAMKGRMEALPEHHISDITTALQGEFIPHIMRAAGARGQVMPQLGGWMGTTNPSRVIQVNDPSKADLVARMAGHVFRQDGMMHTSMLPHEGSEPNGMTRIYLPKGANSEHVSSLYKKIYDEMGSNAASGHSTNLNEGAMDIFHDPEKSKLSPDEHAQKISNIIGPNYDTKAFDAHASFPSHGDYENGLSGLHKGSAPGSSPSERPEDYLQAQAAARLESYIRAAEAQEDKTGRLRLPTTFPYEGGPDAVSTRLPTTKRALAAGALPKPGAGPQLQTEASSQRAEIADHNALLANNSHPGLKPTDNPEEAREAYLDLTKRNLLAIHDRFSPQAKATSAGWYRSANYVGKAISKDHSLPERAGHAIVSVLSPQNPWDNNVSMGERVADVLANGSDTKWSPEMDKVAARIWKPKDKELLDQVSGRTLGELKGEDDHKRQAMWIRTFDEAHNSKKYKSIDPSGKFGVTYKNPYNWFSLDPISKAVSIFHDPSVENISKQLGEKNKVRSFYQKIAYPDDPNTVVADTHAVAAAHGRPLGAVDDAVNHNFGTSPEKKQQKSGWMPARGDSDTGLHGTYGLTADAHRLAAQERGILPSEMQSIVWEGARNLFDGKKSRANKEAVDKIWNRYRDGEISHSEAWDHIIDNMGGIKRPAWADAGEPTGPGDSRSYAGPLAYPSNPESTRKAPTSFARGGPISSALMLTARALKKSTSRH